MNPNIFVILVLALVSFKPTTSLSATRLTIGHSTINPRISPLWIAQEKGYFRKHGIAAKLEMYDTAQPMAQALVEGQIDVAGYTAMPITYSHKGRQYVTVLSGIGGLYWNINRESLKDKVPQGGSVWTFALLPE